MVSLPKSIHDQNHLTQIVRDGTPWGKVTARKTTGG